jgi:hypothetical protein
MDFENCKKFIEAGLEEYPEDFGRFYGMILDHIHCMENEKPVSFFDANWAKSMVLSSLNDCLCGDTSWKHLQFLEGFANLIYNWNSNLLKDESIGLCCQAINRIIVSAVNTKSIIEVLKGSTEFISRYRNWYPPAYDLSIPYLEDLLDRAEKLGK